MLGRSMPGWKGSLKPGLLFARHMRRLVSQYGLLTPGHAMSGRCVQAYLCPRLYVGNVGGNRQFTLVVNIRGAPSRREYPRSTSRRAYLIVDFCRRQNDRSVWPGSDRVQCCHAHITASTCAEGRKVSLLATRGLSVADLVKQQEGKP